MKTPSEKTEVRCCNHKSFLIICDNTHCLCTTCRSIQLPLRHCRILLAQVLLRVKGLQRAQHLPLQPAQLFCVASPPSAVTRSSSFSNAPPSVCRVTEPIRSATRNSASYVVGWDCSVTALPPSTSAPPAAAPGFSQLAKHLQLELQLGDPRLVVNQRQCSVLSQHRVELHL